MTMLSPATPDTTVWALSADGYSVITKDALSEQLLQMDRGYDSVEKLLAHIKSRLWEWWWGTESWSISILASLNALIQENANVDGGKLQDGSIVVAHEEKLAFSPDVLRTIYDDLSNYQHDLYTNLSEQSNHIPLSTLYHLIQQREFHRWDVKWKYSISMWVMQEITNTILHDITSPGLDDDTVSRYTDFLLTSYRESDPHVASTVIQTLNRAYEDMRLSHDVDHEVLARIDYMKKAFLWAIPEDKLLIRFTQAAMWELSHYKNNATERERIFNRIIEVYDQVKERQPNLLASFFLSLQWEMRYIMFTNKSEEECYKSLQSRSRNPLIATWSWSYDYLEGKYMVDFLYGWQPDEYKTPWLIQTIHTSLQVFIEEHKIDVQQLSCEECLAYVKLFLIKTNENKITKNPYMYWLSTRLLEEDYAIVDDLLATPDITQEAVYQLQRIRENVPMMVVNSYDMKRISVIDGRVAVDWQRFVAEDGWDRNHIKGKTYPQYAESLFEMAGSMIGKKFKKPSNRWQIQDATVDGNIMINALNTSENKAILVKLAEIIGFNGYIPLWFDKEGRLICVHVRSVFASFFRHDFAVLGGCLVPSKLP